jgi:hypothetical protein
VIVGITAAFVALTALFIAAGNAMRDRMEPQPLRSA